MRRVLVEVDEDTFTAFFLPPRVGDRVRATARELARDRDRTGAHLDGRPLRLEPDVHVDAAVAGGLGPAFDAHLVEQRPYLVRGGTRFVETHSGLRVEIDAQLVGVLVVVGVVRPHVEAETAEVHRPHDVREIGRHQCS